MIVGFLGPDGVGKTTVINALRKRLANEEVPFHYHHWRVRWDGVAGGSGNNVVTRPHGNPPYGRLCSTAKLVYLFLCAWPAWLRWVPPAQRRGEWIILDRGPADLICDPLRYRYGGPLWLAKLWLACMPKPQLTIVLNAEAAVIHDRKQEVDSAELSRQLMQYRGFRGPRYAHIDAAPEASVVIDIVLRELGLGPECPDKK